MVIDWSKAPPPWNTLGPKMASAIRVAVSRVYPRRHPKIGNTVVSDREWLAYIKNTPKLSSCTPSHKHIHIVWTAIDAVSAAKKERNRS